MKGLMDEGMEEEKTERNSREVDSELVYQLSKQFLTAPEGSDMVAQVLTGARDQAQAVAKIASMIISRVEDELEKRGMPVSDDSAFDEDGSLVKVLTAVYEAAAKAGIEISMEETIIQAYEIAESDLEAASEVKEREYGA